MNGKPSRPVRGIILPAGLIIIALVLGVYAWYDYIHAEVIVEWKTASELSTVGFNLYRSESVGGTYSRINSALIPASPDPLTGGSYSYKDDQVKAGMTYYYQLEDVESDGSASRYGPIEVRAKQGAWPTLFLSVVVFLSGMIGIVRILGRRAREDDLQPL